MGKDYRLKRKWTNGDVEGVRIVWGDNNEFDLAYSKRRSDG